MHKFKKGARTERELLHMLYNLGFSVIRSAGSGVNALSPDILALKDRVCIAFECKAWEKNRLSIKKEQYNRLKKWFLNTNFPVYIGWRMNGKGWYFFKLEELKESKDFGITKKEALSINRRLSDVINELGLVIDNGDKTNEI